jgi:hypothetical protein
MSPVILAVVAFLGYRYYKSKNAEGTGEASSVSSSIRKFLSDPALVSVVLNGTVLICGIVYVITFSSSFRVYTMIASLLNSAYIIAVNYLIFEDPRQPSKSLKEKLASGMTGAEFPYLFLPLMFMNANATESMGGQVFPFGIGDYLVVVILVRRAVWFLGNHGSKSWVNTKPWVTIAAPLWSRLKSHEASILHLSVLAEIFIGFWLIVLVVTPARQLINTFVYWNYLRMKMLSPRSRPGHSAGWASIDKATAGIRARVPFVEKPTLIAKKWFNKE